METWAKMASAEFERSGLLIAAGEGSLCQQMAEIFSGSGYRVTVARTASELVADVMKGVARVVLIGSELEGCRPGELVALLKDCNPDLNVILVFGDPPVPLLQKLRQDGVFYHALRPLDPEGAEEIRQAVRCAFESHPVGRSSRARCAGS